MEERDDDEGDAHPGGTELCNLADDDCNGSIDDKDADGDGYIDDDPVCGGDDCDDNDSNINPAATEICDAIDNDCDGEIDEGCPCASGEERPCGTNVGACRQGTSTCQDGQWGPCTGGVEPAAEDIAANPQRHGSETILVVEDEEIVRNLACELLELVDSLRAEGKRVIWELPGQTGDAAAMQCDAVIRRKRDGWVVDRNN